MSNLWESPQIGTESQAEYAQHVGLGSPAMKAHSLQQQQQQQHFQHAQAMQQHVQNQQASQTPLTPPLTPASSSTDGLCSNTPPDPSSPTVRIGLIPTQKSAPFGSSVDVAAPKSIGGGGPTNMNMSPLLRAITLDGEPMENSGDSGVQTGADQSEALSIETAVGRRVESEPQNGRFLLIVGIPRDANTSVLRDAFKPCGDIKGICVRFQEQHGIVILAFYDIRHAQRAKNRLVSQPFFGNVNLDVREIAISELRKLLGQSSFLSESEAQILVTTEESKIDSKSLQSILSSFGELRAFNQLSVPNQQAFVAEYFDCRPAMTAINALHGRSMLGIRLRLCTVSSVTHPHDQGHSSSDLVANTAGTIVSATGSFSSFVPFPQNNNIDDISPLSHPYAQTGPSYGRVSQPTSPLTPIPRLIPETQQAHFQSMHGMDTQQHFDTTNSSPFHANRALPPLMHSSSSSNLNGRVQTARRISTGSVNLAVLHLSQSDQDLRRRAAVGAANASASMGDKVVEGVLGRVVYDAHARSVSSDTHGIDNGSGRVNNGAVQTIAQTSALRSRQRAISESSASPSPRIPSPADAGANCEGRAGKPSDNAGLEFNVEVNGVNVRHENGMFYSSHPTQSYIPQHQQMHYNSPPILDPLRIPDTPTTPDTPIYTTSGTGSSPPTPSMLTTPGRAYPNSPVFWRVDAANIAAPVPQMVMPISPMSSMTPVNGHVAHALSPTQYGHAQYITGTPDIRALQYVSAEYSPRRLASTYDTYPQSGYGHAYNAHAYGQLQSPSSFSPTSPGDATFLHANTSHHAAAPPSPGSGSGSGLGGRDSSDKNQIDLHKIAAGIDTRTTVMIKNIPNKLTDRDLVEYIGKVCPRKIDFLYLRMDFQNGCNVGYAFVNFIQVEDLLHFAKSKLGVKWNMFSSEKVLQMSYANYQGKEALVEKFKNSCVMDERESWRPKIFYSNGPRQGLPEPFPSPTHLRRKERSSQNRGALYTPGPAHGGSHGGGVNGGLYHGQGNSVHGGRMSGSSPSSGMRRSSGQRGDNQY